MGNPLDAGVDFSCEIIESVAMDINVIEKEEVKEVKYSYDDAVEMAGKSFEEYLVSCCAWF